LQGERTPKLGDCAIGDFQEMVMGNYHQGRAPNDDGLIYINVFSTWMVSCTPDWMLRNLPAFCTLSFSTGPRITKNGAHAKYVLLAAKIYALLVSTTFFLVAFFITFTLTLPTPFSALRITPSHS
jgi:hypothetical protein